MKYEQTYLSLYKAIGSCYWKKIIGGEIGINNPNSVMNFIYLCNKFVYKTQYGLTSVLFINRKNQD